MRRGVAAAGATRGTSRAHGDVVLAARVFGATFSKTFSKTFEGAPSDGDVDEPEFGVMRFEDAVELAAALAAAPRTAPRSSVRPAEETEVFSRVSVEATKMRSYA